MTAVSPRQIGAIHSIAKRLKLDDEVRRDIIARETGKRSSRDLTFAEAGRVIESLKALSTTVQGGFDNSLNGTKGLAGRYAGKLRALWISGWNLGVVRDRSDKALLAFVERQTGLSHTRFLREPRDAARAIEGLKAWLGRAAGVEWPAADADVLDVKRAVIVAQRRLLGLGNTHDSLLDPDMLDHAAQALGHKLRRRRAADPSSSKESPDAVA
ncbi:MAG: regulatory protein GemA [Pseudolabrys sp.]